MIPCECKWAAWAIAEIERLAGCRLSLTTALHIIAYLNSQPSDPERDAILEILSPYRDKNA